MSCAISHIHFKILISSNIQMVVILFDKEISASLIRGIAALCGNRRADTNIVNTSYRQEDNIIKFDFVK